MPSFVCPKWPSIRDELLFNFAKVLIQAQFKNYALLQLSANYELFVKLIVNLVTKQEKIKKWFVFWIFVDAILRLNDVSHKL